VHYALILTADLGFLKPMEMNSLADVDQIGKALGNNLLIL
jgi:hypothetical protein